MSLPNKQNVIYRFFYRKIYLFFERFFTNIIIRNFPSWTVRKFWLRIMGVKIGERSHIDMSTYFLATRHLAIGKYVHINQGCFIDARGTIIMGDNISISHYVRICSGGHNLYSPTFDGEHSPIIIEDYCWVGIGATILKGVTLGEGCVVAAGSVVTKNVDPYSIVGGVPAKKIGTRISNLRYKPLENENHFRYL